VIFLEDDFSVVEYRRAKKSAESRNDCGQTATGQFAPKNDCASGDSAGSATVQQDNSWKSSDKGVIKWDAKTLKEKSPVKGGDTLSSFTIKNADQLREAQKNVPLNLNEIVAVGGGVVRGSEITVHAYSDDNVSVYQNTPIDPSSPQDGFIESSVDIIYDHATKEKSLHFNTLFPLDAREKSPGVFTPAGEKDDLTDSQRSRIASVMMERFVESISLADEAGFSHAEMLAVGSKGSQDKGYRLWPQFGFDAEVPSEHASDVYDWASKSASVHGDNPPSWAVDIIDTVDSGKPLTIQQLISSREGERWWDDNGETLDLTLRLTDKASDGYKRFEKMKGKLARLKNRNKSRSVEEWLVEFRTEDCGQTPTGQFAPKNNCAGDGNGPSSTPKPKERYDTWTERKGSIRWDKNDLSTRPPVTGGDVLESFRIDDAQPLKRAIAGISSAATLDDIVDIGGGVRAGGEVEVYTDDIGILVTQKMPISPDGDKSLGTISTEVSIRESDGDGFEVHYDGLFVNMPEGDDGLPIKIGGGTQSQVASLVMQRMTESLSKAESIGIDFATTAAAGNVRSSLKGYRLWPQFGFDGEIPLRHARNLKEELTDLRGSQGENTPKWATDLLVTLEAGEDVYVQDLIATREGEQWWDENGSMLSLRLDFSDKSSRGAKRFEKMKSRLARLKDRNKNRSIEGWWIDDVEDRGADKCNRTPAGEFAPKNDCAAGDGGGSEEKPPKVRNVDVMLGSGKTVGVIDEDARTRAANDLASNPKPAGSAAGSAADLWDRPFVDRNDPTSESKITSLLTDAFAPERLRQGGSYVAHEAVGQFLSMRHEESRKSAGGKGPGAIIDTTTELTPSEKQYVVDALSEDAIHAYEVGGFDPGFYSSDLESAMTSMSTVHPEIASDENSRFMFTILTAITSNGQDPNVNLLDADAIYSMWKEHGTIVPANGQQLGEGEGGEDEGSNEVGGARDIRSSLIRMQSLIDSFGVDRTRRLLSGYTTVERLNRTLKSLSDRSGDPAWRERTGASPWMTDHFSSPPSKSNLIKQGKGKTGSTEFPDEVVPMAAIFGPKIGSFYANLSGRHDFLTMDRWLMRSVGRVTGELITRTSPDSAKNSATKALESLSASRSTKMLFGLDKSHGLKKADIIRSLKIQAATGVVEENGAAFLWGKAAARSYQKTPREGGKGSYGKSEDPALHEAHSAGNTLSKSLIKEQQTPRGSPGRRNIREVFREVVKKIEEKYPERKGKVDVDEVQAVLWQYEKNLWKHLGAKVIIDKNSLYSKAAEKLLAREKRKTLRPETRSYDEYVTDLDTTDAGTPRDYDTGYLDSSQWWWDGELDESNISFVELFSMLEEADSEKRNFSALDAFISGIADGLLSAFGVEVRAADCGRDESGKFGSGNQCQTVYHGTDADDPESIDFNEVSKSENSLGMLGNVDVTRHGIFLSDSKDFSAEYGKNIGEFSLDAKKVADINPTRGGEHSQVVYEFLDSLDATGSDRDVFMAAKYSSPWKPWLLFDNKVGEKFASWLKSSGYDAAQFKESLDGSGGTEKSGTTYVVFDRKRIKPKKQSRSADCGRDDDGKFGPKNDCAGEGGSQSSGMFGKAGESNDKFVWPASSRETAPPPFKGADEYGTVSVSAPKQVSESLSSIGTDPETAVRVAGGVPGSDVFIRPAPEFSEEKDFKGSGITPVLFDFERDAAGVANAISGSAVIGAKPSRDGGRPEMVAYLSTIVASDEVKADPAKRQTVAREFYRTMVSSIEASRKAGVSKIVFNAAGNSRKSGGGSDDSWRGYTIWPRMGFDAPLPSSITQKLPDDLSHVRSLLELHATPEGTRWWAKNGEDIDVTFDLKDRSSPQSKIMDRFIKRFSSEKRDWLSADDQSAFDELWQEIWDEGLLDDYEHNDGDS
jgi:hypothetical protein